MRLRFIKRLLIISPVILFFHAAQAQKWEFKRAVTIDNPGDKVADAVVQIRFDSREFDFSKAKANGADLRFSAGNGLKGNGLSYWIEEWNTAGTTRIWVKIPVLKRNKSLKINMYYGNASAEPVSSGASAFSFFDDFESGDYTQKWTNTSIGQVAETGGLLKLKESDGQDGIITANFRITGKMIVRTLYQRGNGDQHWTRAGLGGWNYFLCFGDHTDFDGTGTNYVMIYDANSLSSLKTAPLIKAANKTLNDRWRRAAFWYDGRSLNGMQDDIFVKWPVKNAASALSLRTLDNDAWDNFAYITVSPYGNAEPVVTLGPQQVN